MLKNTAFEIKLIPNGRSYSYYQKLIILNTDVKPTFRYLFSTQQYAKLIIRVYEKMLWLARDFCTYRICEKSFFEQTY